MARKLDTRLKPVHPVVAGLFSLLLLVACFVFAVNFYVSLFGGPAWLGGATSPVKHGRPVPGGLFDGPAWLWGATLLSLMLAAGGVFMVVTGRRLADPRCLTGTFPWLRVLDVPLTRAGQVAAIALLVAYPMLFFSSGYLVDGCIEAGDPVFTPREEYRLVNHGIVTEVSRRRFLIVGISGTVATHATFLAVAFFPLHFCLATASIC